MPEVIDLVGKRFGKLLVIQRHDIRGDSGQIKWECVCDCGNKHIVTGESLRSGKSKSCGCLRHTPPNRLRDRELAVWKQLFNSTIIKRSKRMGIKSDIAIDEFIRLSKDKCFYCGLVGSNFQKDRNSAGKYSSDTVIRYNGIDRLDSNRGYTKDNSVTCCKFCNTSKNSMSRDAFMDFIKRVYIYNFRSSLPESKA